MGILSVAFRNDGAPSRPTAVGSVFSDFLGFGSGATTVNARASLNLSSFFNGVNIISCDIAMLPVHVYKKEGRNRNKYPEHPANKLISQRPSFLMNSFELWRILITSAILKGDGFAEIVRNASTGIEEKILFREYDDVQVLESGDKLYYRYKGRIIDGADMIHLKGFTLNGKKGVGVITYAAASLGVSLESQAYAGEVYRNKGLTYGVIETEKDVNPAAREKISAAFTKAMNGKDVHRAPVLDEGLTYKSIGITPAEAQFLETNKAAIGEVGRWLNIPLHKLGELSNANHSNIYQQSIEYVQYSLLPWIRRLEQELNHKLFSESEWETVYVKINEKFLLRGDLTMKKDFYTAAIYSGYMSRNDVRALEDMNPVEGLDDFLQPTNMQTIEFMLEQLKEKKDAGNQAK